MPSFDEYIMRHSEGWVLYIVEQIERVEGIRYRILPPLEERWDVLMNGGNGFSGAPALRLAA